MPTEVIADESAGQPSWLGAKLGSVNPRTWFSIGNLVAGISVGAYLIPQAMAYGTLAGVGAAVGLAVAVIPLAVYAILGKHKWMSVGPESSVALMAAAAAAPAATASGLPPTVVLPVMAAMVGVALVLGRLLNAGFLADLLSYPVLVGYLTGIAVLMVMSQFVKLTGIEANTDDLWSFFTQTEWKVPDWSSLAVGLIVCAIAWSLPKVNSRIPGAIIALAVSIPLGMFFDIGTIGPVSTAVPVFAVPDFDPTLMKELIWPALTVAAVAFTDVMVTARAINDGTRVDTNREMVAIGGAQFATGFFGGFPVSASSSRTALARASGATSKHYAFVVIAVILVAPLIFGGLLAKIPTAGLAGIILFAAISLFDIPAWRKILRLHRNEFAIALACTLAVLLFGILPGIGIAIGLSIFAFLARMARPTAQVLGFTPMSASMHGVDTHDDTDTLEGLVVFRYNAPLFFINAPDFFEEATAVLQPDTKVLLINMEASANLDVTSLDTMSELANYVKGAGAELWLARVRFEVEELLEDHGAMQVIGTEHFYETLMTAVAAYRSRFRD